MQKRIVHALAIAGALLFWGVLAAQAQTQTNVTATIVDPLGIPYANGTYSVQLIPAGTNPTVNGNSIGGAFNGRLDANGSFNISLWPNSAIVPGGTQWQFTICIPGGIQPPLGTGGQCTPPTAVTISGATQNLSSTLSAVAPRLTTITLGSGSVTSVSCGDLVNVFTCTVLNPTTTPALVFSPLSAGPTLDCSTFPGAPDIGLQWNNCIAVIAADFSGAGTADGTQFPIQSTLTTPVVNNTGATMTSCGQYITQVGNVSLTGTGANWVSCPGGTFLDKTADIDQITVTGAGNTIKGLTLLGEADTPFMGDGIVLNGSTDTTVDSVNVNSEAGADIHAIGTNGTTRLTNSEFNDSRAHSLYAQSSIVSLDNDQFTDGGSGTGPTIENAAGPNVAINASHIFVTTRSANPSFKNGQVGGVSSLITTSQFLNTGGQPAMILSSTDIVTANVGIFGGGPGQPAIQGPLGDPGGAATISNNQNVENAAGSDTIRVGGETHVEGNYLFVTLTGEAGMCGINVFGVSNVALVQRNSITLSGGESGSNAGVCVTPQAAQPADGDKIRDNFITAATTSDVGVKFDNTAAVANSSGNQFTGNFLSGASGITVSRIDTANNANFYSNNRGPGAPFDAGGSTADIVVYNSDPIAFASFPAIVGNDSIIACTNCTQGIAAAGGAGGIATRTQGAWLTSPSTTVPGVSSGFGTGAAVVAGGVPLGFRLGVGTANTGTGIISLPVAKTGWNCSAQDITTTSAAVSQTKQIATGSDSSHAAFQNYTDLGATGPWVDSDVLAGTCTPF